MHRTSMGLYNSKSEKVSSAVKDIESLNKTGKQQVLDILETFREIDSKILILKNEQEFITRDLQKLDNRNISSGSKGGKIVFRESFTQTERDNESSLSIENETLRNQTDNLEKEIANLKTNFRQEEKSTGGSIITNVACTALFPDDKYFPVGSDLKDQYVMMQREYEKVLKEKEIAVRNRDISNNKMREVEAELTEMGELRKQIQELRGHAIVSSDRKECNISEIIREKENTIMEYKRDMDDKINKLEEQDKTIRNLQQQIEQIRILMDEKDIQMHSKDQQKNEKDNLIVNLQRLKDVTDMELTRNKNRLEQAQTSIKDLQNQLVDNENDLKRLRKKLADAEGKVKDVENQRGDAKAENDKLKTELDRLKEVEKCNSDLQKRLCQIEDQYKVRGDAIEEKKKEIARNDEKITQKEFELNSLQKEMDTVTKKLKNELSLESVNVQNAKVKINELEQSVSTLHQILEETTLENKKIKSQQIKLTEENLRIQNELDTAKQINKEIKQKKRLISEEKSRVQNELDNLQEKINKTLEEKTRLHSQLEDLNKIFNIISSQNDHLRQENESLKQEKEKLAAKALVKRCISFHTVLKQPQSEQAESGIVSLLQQELGVTLEIIPESKRSKNVPLLVVLYNLSRITDDVKGALIGIEASSDVALVILHSKEVQKASEQILTHVDFKKLGIIVDISFISAKGIISNEVTSGGIQQLAKFINTF